MDKTLLVLGGGPDQIPGVLKAKEMGVYTIVLDGDKDASAKQYADEFHIVSIKHFKQIESFITNTLTKKVDGVIAFGVDIASIIVKTADLLGVNYTIPLESALLSEDKFLSKEFMKKYFIPVPKYKQVKALEEIQSFIDEVGFPVIIKPVDNSASRGISFVKDQNEISKAYRYAINFTDKKHLLVEEYLTGPQVSTESFIVNGKVYDIGFADRNYEDMNKFLPNIIENGGDLPSVHMTDLHKISLHKYLEEVAKQLNIQNGIIKGDIVVYNGSVNIIEFALRLSGGNFSTIEIPESTGVDFIKIAIKLHLNMKIDEDELTASKNKNISLRYKFCELTQSQIIKQIQLPLKNENIIFSNFHAREGDVISEKTTNHAERMGFAIAKGKTREDAIKNAQTYLDNVEIFFE